MPLRGEPFFQQRRFLLADGDTGLGELRQKALAGLGQQRLGKHRQANNRQLPLLELAQGVHRIENAIKAKVGPLHFLEQRQRL